MLPLLLLPDREPGRTHAGTPTTLLLLLPPVGVLVAAVKVKPARLLESPALLP
jgi:hypothetical protein